PSSFPTRRSSDLPGIFSNSTFWLKSTSSWGSIPLSFRTNYPTICGIPPLRWPRNEESSTSSHEKSGCSSFPTKKVQSVWVNWAQLIAGSVASWPYTQIDVSEPTRAISALSDSRAVIDLSPPQVVVNSTSSPSSSKKPFSSATY